MTEVTTFSRYRLVRRIARGGMAEVYLALHRGVAGFERPVALKKILPVYVGMEEFNKLFRDEARISASLDHSGIVSVHDFGEQDGEYYIVMEYVDGPDLEEILDRCRRRGILPPVEVVLHLGHRLASALEYAHSRVIDGQAMQIIHRDVSPPNVLIGVTGEVKLTDFGVARAALREAPTRPGVLRGKYAYMSPEQVSHKPMDHRSDIFSLGTVLYETLTGINPFDQSTDFQTMEAVEHARMEPAGFLRPDTPAELDRILLTCLQLDATDRYQDAGELRRDIAKLVLDYQQADEPQCLVEFLRDVFPERTRDPSMPGGDAVAPAWEHLVHRLSPMLVDMPDRLPGATKSPIRLVPRPPSKDEHRPPTDQHWPIPIVPEFMAPDGTAEEVDLSDQSWTDLVDGSDPGTWPPSPTQPHPAAVTDSLPPARDPMPPAHDAAPDDTTWDESEDDEGEVADPFGPHITDPGVRSSRPGARVDNEWSEDDDPDGVQTEPHAVVPSIGVPIPRPTKKRILKPPADADTEARPPTPVYTGFLPSPERLTDSGEYDADVPVLGESSEETPSEERMALLPPQGTLEEDPLLRSVTVMPAHTEDGVPILNEWDLDERAFDGPPVAESTVDAPAPLILSNPATAAPEPEPEPDPVVTSSPAITFATPPTPDAEPELEPEYDTVDPDETHNTDHPVEFTSTPGAAVPMPPGYQAPPQDLWRFLPDDEDAVFDEMSGEFVAPPEPTEEEEATAAAAIVAATERRDRRIALIWLAVAFLVPAVILGAGQFVKSSRAPSVVLTPNEAPVEPPTAAPAPTRREALPPAGSPTPAPEPPPPAEPWTEPTP